MMANIVSIVLAKRALSIPRLKGKFVGQFVTHTKDNIFPLKSIEMVG